MAKCSITNMTLDEAIAHAEEHIDDTPCGQNHRQLAEWLKELRELKQRLDGNAALAAPRRIAMEANDMAKMREALELCYRIIHCAMVTGVINRDDANKAMYAYHAALAAPPRNCDIGDVDEQERRYRASTDDAYHTLTLSNVLEWEQMPYAEGTAESKGQQGDEK